MVKVCDGCRFLNPQESHPDTEVHFCQLRGHRVYHHGHHPNIPRPDFCPISDELARIAALEAERDGLRELVKKLVDVKSEPDKLLCLLEREARRAMEE